MDATKIKPCSHSDVQWVEPPTDGQQEIKQYKGHLKFWKNPALVGLQDHQWVHILVGYADRRTETLSTGRALKPLGSWTFDHCYPSYHTWDKFKRAWRPLPETGGRKHYPMDGHWESLSLWKTSVGLHPATDGQSELCATSWARSFVAKPATDGLWVKSGRCGRPSSGGGSDRWLEGSKWTGDCGSAVEG